MKIFVISLILNFVFVYFCVLNVNKIIKSYYVLKNTFLNITQFYLIKYRSRFVDKDLLETIDVMNSYLTSGVHPFLAMQMISKKTDVGRTINFYIKKIVLNFEIGSSVSQSLKNVIIEVQKHHKSKYVYLFFSACLLSIEKGTSLKFILHKIRDQILDQHRFQKKLKAMTAQIRIQAIIILIAPLFVAVILMFLNPQSLSYFKNSLYGNILIIIMIILEILAFFSLRAIYRKVQ